MVSFCLSNCVTRAHFTLRAFNIPYFNSCGCTYIHNFLISTCPEPQIMYTESSSTTAKSQSVGNSGEKEKESDGELLMCLSVIGVV